MRLRTLTLPLTVAETDIDDWARTVLSVQANKPARRDRMQNLRTLAAARILSRKEAK
jgi:hypothetical protein